MKLRTPSPAMIVACLALLLALTGTAVASTLITGASIKDNTVSSLDVTNGTLKSVDVKDNSLGSVDVQNGSLRAIDFAPGQLSSGPAGPPGPPGAPGQQGQQGAPGLSGLELLPDLYISAFSRFSITVSNRGNATAGTSVLSITNVGTFTIRTLAPGASVTFSWSTCRVAIYTAVVDRGNDVRESDETNNSSTHRNTCPLGVVVP
jgi:hypothetical protein